jgi:hypothetical protein
MISRQPLLNKERAAVQQREQANASKATAQPQQASSNKVRPATNSCEQSMLQQQQPSRILQA